MGAGDRRAKHVATLVKPSVVALMSELLPPLSGSYLAATRNVV